MIQINLASFQYFDTKTVVSLNNFVRVNNSLMPHAIAIATGCRVEQALALLFFLYGKNVVEGYILIYHNAHPDFYFEKSRLQDGLPKRGEFICPVCENTIDDSSLLFDLEFSPTVDIEFEKFE